MISIRNILVAIDFSDLSPTVMDYACSLARTQVPYESVIVTGRPLVEIHQLVRQHAIDCLVLGAHSTDKPEHQLFGSTAERLLQHISCPIFMIPPRQASEFISRG